MKYDFILTSEQQVLVEQHMDLVGWVISRHILFSLFRIVWACMAGEFLV